MKNFVIALLFLLATTTLFAKKSLQEVTVTVPIGTENQSQQYQQGGWVGIIHGVQTRVNVFTLNAVIQGDHAKMTCNEGHKGCSPLGAGDYKGELKGNNIWITFAMPVSHKVNREHWKIVGSW